MDVSYQLSPVNFPSESSPLPSPGIELTIHNTTSQKYRQILKGESNFGRFWHEFELG